MNIPKETKCKYCGERIIFVPGGRGQIPIDVEFAPYTRHPAEGGCDDVLFTAEGGRLNCRILNPERDNEIEGYAHRIHACPVPRPRREPSERERAREEYREFRRQQNDD